MSEHLIGITLLLVLFAAVIGAAAYVFAMTAEPDRSGPVRSD